MSMNKEKYVIKKNTIYMWRQLVKSIIKIALVMTYVK